MTYPKYLVQRVSSVARRAQQQDSFKSSFYSTFVLRLINVVDGQYIPLALGLGHSLQALDRGATAYVEVDTEAEALFQQEKRPDLWVRRW